MAAGKKQHGLGFICPRDNPILSTPSTNSNTISLSPRLLRKFGRGRGNRTPGGPCERTPVFRTGDLANSSTPLHDLAETAGLEPVRFAQGKLCTRVTRTVLARRCDAHSAHISKTRCARGDSNSYAKSRRCLGPLWLPVSPLAQILVCRPGFEPER